MKFRFAMMAAFAAMAFAPPGLQAKADYKEISPMHSSASGHDPGGLVTIDFASMDLTSHKDIVLASKQHEVGLTAFTALKQTLLTEKSESSGHTKMGIHFAAMIELGHSKTLVHLRRQGSSAWAFQKQSYSGNKINHSTAMIDPKEAAYAPYIVGKVIGLRTEAIIERQPNIMYVGMGTHNFLC